MYNWPLRLMIILASCALLWFGMTALNSGTVRVKGGRLISRQESPFNYWLFVGTYFVVGIGGILFAVFGGFFK